MSESGPDPERDLAGSSVEGAVEAVLGTQDDVDPTTAREALEYVATDGVVSVDAAEDALGETATIVSTPETRAELAAIALSEAREAAAPVADLGAVASRLEAFDARLSTIEARLDALGDDLQALVGRDPAADDLFAIGREIGQVRAEADAIQHAADEFQEDVDIFEEWLADPSARAGELRADVEALAEGITTREETLAAVAALGGETDLDAGAIASDDPAEAWAEAAVGHRVSGLIVADLRAELDDLRTMAGRPDATDGAGDEGAPDDGLDVVEARITDLVERRDAVGQRIENLARPAWRDRFEDRIAVVEGALSDAEPPVAWGELEAALEDARS